MTNDKRLKRFERNMSKINDKKLDYKTVDNEWIQIKTIWGEMLFNPYSNHFRLEGKLIYGNASNMIMHLNINKMIQERLNMSDYKYFNLAKSRIEQHYI